MLSLPSLADFDRGSVVRIWLATQPADMRCGFDRLAQLAGSVTGQDPLSGHLFLFRSRGGDRLKALLWEKDGYIIWYKRLEQGTFSGCFAGYNELSRQQFTMLLEGIVPRRMNKRFSLSQ